MSQWYKSLLLYYYFKVLKGEKPKSFTGDSNTVFVNKGAREVVGEKPIEEIRKYLNSLPSKN